MNSASLNGCRSPDTVRSRAACTATAGCPKPLPPCPVAGACMVAPSCHKIAGNVIPADRQNWTHLRWLKEDPEGLAKIKAENPEVFETIRKKHN